MPALAFHYTLHSSHLLWLEKIRGNAWRSASLPWPWRSFVLLVQYRGRRTDGGHLGDWLLFSGSSVAFCTRHEDHLIPRDRSLPSLSVYLWTRLPLVLLPIQGRLAWTVIIMRSTRMDRLTAISRTRYILPNFLKVSTENGWTGLVTRQPALSVSSLAMTAATCAPTTAYAQFLHPLSMSTTFFRCLVTLPMSSSGIRLLICGPVGVHGVVWRGTWLGSIIVHLTTTRGW